MWKVIVALLLALFVCTAQAVVVLDPSFGEVGFAYVDTSAPGGPVHLAVAPDHGIVVAWFGYDDRQLHLAKLRPDGTLDDAFGDHGTRDFALGHPERLAILHRLQPLANGDLFVFAGQYLDTATGEAIVLRLDSRGNPKPDFNNGETLRLSMPAEHYSWTAHVHGNGFLFATVPTASVIGQTYDVERASHARFFRITAEGLPDTNFGVAGHLVEPERDGLFGDTMLLPGGGFQVLHASKRTDGSFLNRWRRYRADGNIDHTAGIDGWRDVGDNGRAGLVNVFPLEPGRLAVANTNPALAGYLDGEGRMTVPMQFLFGTRIALPYSDGRMLVGYARESGFTTPPGSDGTFAAAVGADGAPDFTFTTPGSNEMRLYSRLQRYNIAVDSPSTFVMGESMSSGQVRITRYLERRGAEAQPVPALGTLALLLVGAGMLALAARNWTWPIRGFDNGSRLTIDRIDRGTGTMWKALIIAAILSWPCLGHAELIPDTTFGNNGTVDIPLGGTQYTNPARIAVLPDRRIVVARLDSRPDEAPIMPSLSLARLLPDGRPDPTFGSGGIATFALTGTTVLRAFAPTLVVQPDGSAFALAQLVTIDPDSSFVQTDLVVLHITADGRADPAFNGGQPVRFRADIYSRFKPFVQPDGLLIVGFGNAPSTVGARRFRMDGTPDAAFGTAGSLEITASTWMSDVMPVPGGGFQILHRSMDGTSAFWRRHRANGTLDTAFGSGGDAAIPSFGGRGIAYVHALGDGTFLGAQSPSCGRYVLDAEGRVQSTFNGTCDPAHDRASLNARAEAWRGGILMSGLQVTMSITSPSDCTYLWLLDRQGRPDAEFVAPQSLRWRPPPGVVAGNYAVAADADLGVVVALADNGYVPDAVRVQRYTDVRRGITSIQPVPALGLPAMLLMLAGAAMLTRRRLARR